MVARAGGHQTVASSHWKSGGVPGATAIPGATEDTCQPDPKEQTPPAEGHPGDAARSCKQIPLDWYGPGGRQILQAWYDPRGTWIPPWPCAT